jgi:hypothetical protein
MVGTTQAKVVGLPVQLIEGFSRFLNLEMERASCFLQALTNR